MVLIKKHHLQDHSFVQIFTPQKTILFDYSAPIYGHLHRRPTISAPPKDLKFIIKDIQNVDCLFVTSSESLGCLFVESSVAVYCTQPVYEQLLLKYEEYVSLSLTYDDEMEKNDSKIVSIKEINIESFKNNVILIKYNQQIDLDATIVSPVPSGTFIGWCNYKIIFPNGESLLYLTSYFHKRRFSIKASPIDSTYIIINRKEISPENDLELFTNFLINKDNDVTMIFPLPMETLFIEVFLHVLSVLDHTNIPIYVISSIFQKLQLLINIQNEWLNEDFCISGEPFPLKEYAHLYHVDSFNSEFKDGSKIIFCSDFHYELLGNRWLFNNQIDVNIDHNTNIIGEKFNIKMESTQSEILDNSKAILIDSDELFISTSSNYSIIKINSLLNVMDDLLYVSGKLLNTDAFSADLNSLEILEDKCWLSKLLETQEYLLIDGWIIFKKEKIKCRIVSDRRIEYEEYV